MSNYVADVVYKASDFSSRFGSKLGIPDMYLDFIKLPVQSSSQPEDLLALDMSEEIVLAKLFTGRMKVTPDSKKEIEFVYEKANFIVFSFMIRLIIELLSIDDIPEHPGFEGLVGMLTFQLKIKEAQACFLSGQETCLVVKGILV